LRKRAWLEVAAGVGCNGKLSYNCTPYIGGYDFYGTVEQRIAVCYSNNSKFDSCYMSAT